MTDMNRRANRSRCRQLPGSAAVLGGGRDAGNTQLLRNRPFVHQPALSQVQVLAVGADGKPQPGGLLQSLQQQPGTAHRRPVIA